MLTVARVDGLTRRIALTGSRFSSTRTYIRCRSREIITRRGWTHSVAVRLHTPSLQSVTPSRNTANGKFDLTYNEARPKLAFALLATATITQA